MVCGWPQEIFLATFFARFFRFRTVVWRRGSANSFKRVTGVEITGSSIFGCTEFVSKFQYDWYVRNGAGWLTRNPKAVTRINSWGSTMSGGINVGISERRIRLINCCRSMAHSKRERVLEGKHVWSTCMGVNRVDRSAVPEEKSKRVGSGRGNVGIRILDHVVVYINLSVRGWKVKWIIGGTRSSFIAVCALEGGGGARRRLWIEVVGRDRSL